VEAKIRSFVLLFVDFEKSFLKQVTRDICSSEVLVFDHQIAQCRRPLLFKFLSFQKIVNFFESGQSLGHLWAF